MRVIENTKKRQNVSSEMIRALPPKKIFQFSLKNYILFISRLLIALTVCPRIAAFYPMNPSSMLCSWDL